MFVNESLEDILKPKGSDEIRKNFKDLIFWKGIADGKMSPSSLKYFLDKNFIEKKRKEHSISFPIKSKSDKVMLHIIDLDYKALNLEDNDFTIRMWRKQRYTSSEAVHRIKLNIEREYKRLNGKYFKQTGKELRESLYEERLGDYHYKDKEGEFHFVGVYKNPVAITKMDSGIRAISDKDGNLYIIDKAHFLHDRIIDYLQMNGFVSGAHWDYDNHYYKNIVAWHRINKTNKFYLSESYSENMDVVHLPEIQDMIQKVREKNPQFEFIEENIYDAKFSN